MRRAIIVVIGLMTGCAVGPELGARAEGLVEEWGAPLDHSVVVPPEAWRRLDACGDVLPPGGTVVRLGGEDALLGWRGPDRRVVCVDLATRFLDVRPVDPAHAEPDPQPMTQSSDPSR